MGRDSFRNYEKRLKSFWNINFAFYFTPIFILDRTIEIRGSKRIFYTTEFL